MKIGDTYESKELGYTVTILEIDELRGFVTVSGVEHADPWTISATTWYYCEFRKVTQPHCQHSWIDTGMRKTYCKHCDTAGWLDPMTGKVAV